MNASQKLGGIIVGNRFIREGRRKWLQNHRPGRECKTRIIGLSRFLMFGIRDLSMKVKEEWGEMHSSTLGGNNNSLNLSPITYHGFLSC